MVALPSDRWTHVALNWFLLSEITREIYFPSLRRKHSVIFFAQFFMVNIFDVTLIFFLLAP